MTIRQLLTHTSGFRAWIPLYNAPTHEQKLELIWNQAPVNPPGTKYLYSDLNLISLQLVLEKITGRPLDTQLRDEITAPLGMHRTRYNPPASWKPRIAATEDARKPWSGLDRGLVWGEVHDENAYGLGGVAGHAGVFSSRLGPGRSRPYAAQRRRLRQGTHPVARLGRADVHRLQHRLPRRRARSRLRALPALVHGRDGHAPHRGAHRLHRYLDRPRPDDRLLPRRPRQLRSSRAQLALRLRTPGRRREQPGPRGAGPPTPRTYRLVLRHGERDDGDAHPPAARHHRRLPPALRPVVGHRAAVGRAVPGVLGGRRRDLAAGPVHHRTRRRHPAGASDGLGHRLVGARLAPPLGGPSRRAGPASCAGGTRPTGCTSAVERTSTA